jgi:predicted amidohydrolase
MMQVDLSELPAALADELVRGRHARDTMTALRAPENQLRVAQSNNVDWKSLDGLGAPTLSITPEAYHYWGQRFSYDDHGKYIGDGYACWRDKQFLAEFKRDNPAARIKAAGTRIQIGAAGTSTETQRPQRFHKSYG